MITLSGTVKSNIDVDGLQYAFMQEMNYYWTGLDKSDIFKDIRVLNAQAFEHSAHISHIVDMSYVLDKPETFRS